MSKKKETIGDRLDALVNKMSKSKKKFAEAVGISPSSVSNSTTNKVNPSSDVLGKISEKYPQINMTWLLSGNGEMFNVPIDEVPLRPEIPQYVLDEKKIMSSINLRVKKLREENRYSMEEMAGILNYNSHSAYASIEYDRIYIPVTKLKILSKVFNKSYDYLIDGIESKMVPVSQSKDFAEKDSSLLRLKSEKEQLERDVKLLTIENNTLKSENNDLKREVVAAEEYIKTLNKRSSK